MYKMRKTPDTESAVSMSLLGPYDPCNPNDYGSCGSTNIQTAFFRTVRNVSKETTAFFCVIALATIFAAILITNSEKRFLSEGGIKVFRGALAINCITLYMYLCYKSEKALDHLAEKIEKCVSYSDSCKLPRKISNA